MVTKTLTVAAMDVGVGRISQEDACLVFDEILQSSNDSQGVVDDDLVNTRGRSELPVQLFAVADGMGGKGVGDLAASVALRSLRGDIEKYALSANRHYLDFADLADIVSENADHAVRQQLAAWQGLSVGTTLSWLMIEDEEAYTFSIGTSRVYLFRDNKLHRITKDHSGPQAGSKPDLYYGFRPQEGRLIPDNLNRISLKKGDILMLTTDGLTRFADDSSLEQLLQQPEAFVTKAKSLCSLALNNAGSDNIAVILVKVQDIAEILAPADLKTQKRLDQSDKKKRERKPGKIFSSFSKRLHR